MGKNPPWAPPKRWRSRDWHRINDKFVQRGSISFYLEFQDTWDGGLARANKGKVGNPFAYPDTLFVVATVLRFLFSTPFRTLEGLFRALGCLARFPAPSYPTIYQRCKKIDLLSHRSPAQAAEVRDLQVYGYDQWRDSR